MSFNLLYCIFISFLIFLINGDQAPNSTLEKLNQTEDATNKLCDDDGCVCTAQYDPVCGSDGKTYGNACALGCVRKRNPYVFGLCKGECPCCKEPFYNDPMVDISGGAGGFWGWNRDTGTPHHMKSNETEKEIEPESELTASITTDSEKKFNCYPDVLSPAGCICTMIYRPVCGSDGKTYGNACVLSCRQRVQPCLSKVCDGKCPCCQCPIENEKNLNAPHNATDSLVNKR